MTVYLVSRHQGATQWMQGQFPGQPVVRISHLEGQTFAPGDRVCGILPLAWAARVCAAGAQALVISMQVPEHLRGHELSAQELDALGACLVRYDVRTAGLHVPRPVEAGP